MALETYKRIHEKFPDNAECLKFLVRICTDMGMKEGQEYAEKLMRLERSKEGRGSGDVSGSGDVAVASRPETGSSVRGGRVDSRVELGERERIGMSSHSWMIFAGVTN